MIKELKITEGLDLYDILKNSKSIHTQKITLDNGMVMMTTTTTPVECKYKIGDEMTIPIYGVNERGNVTVEYFVCKIVEIHLT